VPLPEIRVNETPLSVLRYTPPPSNSVAASTTLPPLRVVGTMLAMRLPANVAAATTVQVAPPSVERATPKPGLPLKLKELVLPVPANRVLESTGLIANELIDSAGSCVSVSGVQVGVAAVALEVFHTPPLTVPTKTMSAEMGTIALIGRRQCCRAEGEGDQRREG
jgi:hypothetical protein